MSLVGERVIRKESAGIGVINKGTAPVRAHVAETALGEGGFHLRMSQMRALRLQ